MALTIRAISDALKASASGDIDLAVVGIAQPDEAGPEDLALAMFPAYAETLKAGRAKAALVAKGTDWKALNLRAAIEVEKPRLALAQVSALFGDDLPQVSGIHPLACLASSAAIGDNTAIGPFTVIGCRVTIGRDCRIASHCAIEDETLIGDGAVIHAGVKIGRGSIIGERFIVHSNAVIGSDGFSFVSEGENRIKDVRASLQSAGSGGDARQIRIHSHGIVRIGNDVEVGAGTAIDRGTVAATEIGDGTKLDNQVHVAHNVRIGRDCLICGHVGIAGSAVIGDRVVLGGMSGVSDHVRVGDDVVAAGASKIYTRVPSGQAVMGSPALEMGKNIELYRSLRRLPRLLKRVSGLESLISSHTKGG